MGVYLSYSRIKIDESKIIGKVQTLGLYEAAVAENNLIYSEIG